MEEALGDGDPPFSAMDAHLLGEPGSSHVPAAQCPRIRIGRNHVGQELLRDGDLFLSLVQTEIGALDASKQGTLKGAADLKPRLVDQAAAATRMRAGLTECLSVAVVDQLEPCRQHARFLARIDRRPLVKHTVAAHTAADADP